MKIFQHRTTLFLLKALFYLPLLFILSCSESMISDKNTMQEHLELKFVLETSHSKLPSLLLRSGQLAGECLINQMQVLVFENNQYKYRLQGGRITDNGNYTTSFIARLQSTTEPLTLYFLANANDVVLANEPQIGESFNDVKKKINQAINATVNFTYYPMWGSYDFPTGISATSENNITGIKMLRSVARIDVSVINTAPFQLATIQAFRVSDQMQLIPDSPTTVPDVSVPSIPTGTTNTINTDPVNTTTTTTSTAQIYLPESEAPSNSLSATCIVVGGYYNGSSTLSYYRLDFNPGVSGHPLGQILRNHRYAFNIINITQQGYSTPLEAANNPSGGVEATMVLWQDFILNMVFDDNGYYGVSSNLVVMQGKANETLSLQTETDIPGYTICWSNASGVPSGSSSTSMIQNDFFQVEKSADGSTIDITTLVENPIGSGIRNIRYVLVEANNLKIVITIIQEPDQFSPGDVIWANANVDQPGTFADKISDWGMFYQWNSKTAWPSTGSVTGWVSDGADGNSWEDANDPCPPGWRVPSSKELTALLKDSPGRKWRSVWNETNYPTSGMWFAPTQAEAEAATLASPGNAVFMPAAGGRNASDGSLYNRDTNGSYWADDLDGGGKPYMLSLVDGTSGVWVDDRASGFTIRCVKANN